MKYRGESLTSSEGFTEISILGVTDLDALTCDEIELRVIILVAILFSVIVCITNTKNRDNIAVE